MKLYYFDVKSAALILIFGLTRNKKNGFCWANCFSILDPADILSNFKEHFARCVSVRTHRLVASVTMRFRYRPASWRAREQRPDAQLIPPVAPVSVRDVGAILPDKKMSN